MLAREGASGIADVCLVGDETYVERRLRHFAEIGVTEFVASPHGDDATVARTVEFLSTVGL